MSAVPASRLREDGLYAVAFALFLGVVIFVGQRTYATERRRLDADARSRLNQMASVKATQVAAWRHERVGDIEVMAADAVLMSEVAQVVHGTASEHVRSQVQARMDAVRANYQYTCVALLDSAGGRRLTSGDLLASLPRYREVLAEAVASTSVIFEDMSGEGVVRPHLVLGASLRSADGSVLGALLLGVDPATALFPSELQWPLASATSEVVLVRRDRDDLLYLSAPRRRPGSEMALRVPLTTVTSPAVRALLGQDGVSEGVDESGYAVLAASKHVPDSPWVVVAKIDAADAFAPLRQTLEQVVIVDVLVLLVVAVFLHDLARHRQQVRNLAFSAAHDPLTKLLTGAAFMDRLTVAAGGANRGDRHDAAVLFVDLNRFKAINDEFGHATGDRLLAAVAGRLRGAVRPDDCVARLGGDEFAVLLEEVSSEADVSAVVDRIRAALDEPFNIGGRLMFSSASVGVAFASQSGPNAQELLQVADTAMYRAKAASRASPPIAFP